MFPSEDFVILLCASRSTVYMQTSTYLKQKEQSASHVLKADIGNVICTHALFKISDITIFYGYVGVN